MVLPWDSGLIPRGMSQGFILNMASVQTHQGLQPECKIKWKIIKDHERGISLHNISSYINHVFIFQNSHQHLKTFQFFFKTRLMYVPPFLSSFIIGYASIHIVFIYVTTFGNESEHNSHITILVFHTTSEEAERIYTGPPFMFPNKHSNMQSRERERKNQQASCQSIAWVLRDLHFISGVKVSAFFSIDCINI